jgi:hypothetical protein
MLQTITDGHDTDLDISSCYGSNTAIINPDIFDCYGSYTTVVDPDISSCYGNISDFEDHNSLELKIIQNSCKCLQKIAQIAKVKPNEKSLDELDNLLSKIKEIELILA